MRSPFDNNGRKKKNNWLLEIDSWIDSSMYKMFSGGSERWENITVFFQRFRVTGFKKFMVEIVDEGFTVGLVGLILLLALALPAFDETSKNWRDKEEYSVVFLDRYGKEIGRRGVRQADSDEIDTLPDHFIKAPVNARVQDIPLRLQHDAADFAIVDQHWLSGLLLPPKN